MFQEKRLMMQLTKKDDGYYYGEFNNWFSKNTIESDKVVIY